MEYMEEPTEQDEREAWSYHVIKDFEEVLHCFGTKFALDNINPSVMQQLATAYSIKMRLDADRG